jgi:propanol-preferring alcohol dehydrogenase
MDVPTTMRAMVLEAPRRPLRATRVPVPAPAAGQVLIRVQACGVCHTDLHILDGELTHPKLPLILGHQIVGQVAAQGQGAYRFALGERVGVPWLGATDGTCRYCLRGQENLCDHPVFTGYTIDGGFAEYAVADQRFCFRLPGGYTDLQVAPLLCAGLIGYRTYRLAGEHVERLGIYGFGAAAHIIAQVARHQGKRIYAFTRPGDAQAQAFARRLGAAWVGGSDELPPEPLDAALIFAPVGPLVVAALKATDKGGVIVCGGIHMSDIPAFPYSLLWEERVVRSVANLTRQDGEEFLAVAPQVPVHTDVKLYPLEGANQALDDLRSGKIEGAAVLRIAEAQG